MTQQDVATWAPPAQPRKRRAGRTVFWVLVGLALAVLAAQLLAEPPDDGGLDERRRRGRSAELLADDG